MLLVLARLKKNLHVLATNESQKKFERKYKMTTSLTVLLLLFFFFVVSLGSLQILNNHFKIVSLENLPYTEGKWPKS